MSKALLLISFGTSLPEARETVTAVEQVLQDTAAGYRCYRAFTSPTIRRKLAARGEIVPSVEEAIEQIISDGFTELVVQPTLMLPGIEQDKISATVSAYAPRFAELRMGMPLLGNHEDIRQLADCLVKYYPPVEGEALVLFGHGTRHFANAAYPALQAILWMLGRHDILVGTVEGFPALQDILDMLSSTKHSKVRLVPLMLVAGEHIINDMASDSPDSWKSRLQEAGYTVDCSFTGLGLLPGVQQLYREHLQAAMGE